METNKDPEEKRSEEGEGEERFEETLGKSLSDFCSKFGLAATGDDKNALFEILGSFKCEKSFVGKACKALEEKRSKDDEELREERLAKLRTDVKAGLQVLSAEFVDMEVDEILSEALTRVDNAKYQWCPALIHYEKIKPETAVASSQIGSSKENGITPGSPKKGLKAGSLGNATSSVNGLGLAQANEKFSISLPSNCGLCEVSLSSPDDFVSHVAEKHEEFLFIPPPCPIPRCSKCCAGFDDWNKLLHHLRDECNDKPLQASMLEIAKQLKTCDCCKVVHDKVEKGESCCTDKRQSQNIRCHLCLTPFVIGSVWDRKKLLHSHMKTFHSKTDEQGSVSYPCPFCKTPHDKVRPLFEHLAEQHYNPGLLRKRKGSPSKSNSPRTKDLKRTTGNRPNSDPNLSKTKEYTIQLANKEMTVRGQLLTKGKKKFVRVEKKTPDTPPKVYARKNMSAVTNSSGNKKDQNGESGVNWMSFPLVPSKMSQMPLPIVKPEPAEHDLNGNEEPEPNTNGAEDTIIGF